MPEAIPELRDATPEEQPRRLQPQPAKVVAKVAANVGTSATIVKPAEPVTPIVPPAPTLDPVEPSAALAHIVSDQNRANAEARWVKRFDWANSPLEECLKVIADMRAELERGSMITQGRLDRTTVSSVECFKCKKVITPGSAAGSRTRKNWETGYDETAYACSAACFMGMTREFVHTYPGGKTSQ